MTSPATLRLVGLVLLVGMVAGCGGPDSLAPPADPLDVVLHWRTYSLRADPGSATGESSLDPVPQVDWRLELRPDGTFRYAWRRVADVEAPWREVVGTTERVRPRTNPTWALRMAGEPQHLDNEMVAGVDLPVVVWSANVGMGASRMPPQWMVQVVDAATGRFTPGFGFHTDPRAGGE